MKITQQYREITYSLIREFSQKYYKEIYNEDADMSDIDIMEHNNFPNMVNISDEYYGIEEIFMVLEYNIPIRILRGYYELCMSTEGKPGINLFNFYKKF